MNAVEQRNLSNEQQKVKGGKEREGAMVPDDKEVPGGRHIARRDD